MIFEAGLALLLGYVVTKGTSSKNLTFGLSFANFGIDKVDISGITLNTTLSIDNASDQTYITEKGYFSLRYPNNDKSGVLATFSYNDKQNIAPRSETFISVKAKLNLTNAVLLVREYLRVKKAGGYIIDAGLVGTISVMGMPGINVNDKVNLYPHLDVIPTLYKTIFGGAANKVKPTTTTTTTTGADSGRDKEVSTNTPTATQKQLVAQGKARSKWFQRKPKV